jgi:hypothetical protein
VEMCCSHRYKQRCVFKSVVLCVCVCNTLSAFTVCFIIPCRVVADATTYYIDLSPYARARTKTRTHTWTRIQPLKLAMMSHSWSARGIHLHQTLPRTLRQPPSLAHPLSPSADTSCELCTRARPRVLINRRPQFAMPWSPPSRLHTHTHIWILSESIQLCTTTPYPGGIVDPPNAIVPVGTRVICFIYCACNIIQLYVYKVHFQNIDHGI